MAVLATGCILTSGPSTRDERAEAPPTEQAVSPTGTGIQRATERRLAAPISNIAGMNASSYEATNRSGAIAVSPDGSRVAIAWLHNSPEDGEPTAYATIGDPTLGAAGFSAPAVIGRRVFRYGLRLPHFRKYDRAHNYPFVLAKSDGGFLGLSVPMNANGWAEGLPATGFHHAVSEAASGSTAWSSPGLGKARSSSMGLTASEMSGGADGDGALHIFGQGQINGWGGAMGYLRRPSGDSLWDSISLAASYRTSGVNYFLEGRGYVSPRRNGGGKNDLHVAFAYNHSGSAPAFGLYYLKSTDSGATWTNAAGTGVNVPLRYGSGVDAAAVIPAQLTSGSPSGADPSSGTQCISVAAAADGTPVVVKPTGTGQLVQNKVYTYTGGRWLGVPVGPLLYWNMNGTGVAVNSKTGRVNVVLLDPGSSSVPGRVLLFHQPLSDLRFGRANWTEEVVFSVANSRNYASSLRVAELADTRFAVLVDSNYQNPGPVAPVFAEAPIR